ncbi:tape measure protein [Thiocystis violascens]|uniref:Tape measure domain protein n=1 Tax=Thiocystis violascens (strain ATCC 17096 / DSM 198 / 6111) TaxID=765911 RepID=I3YGX3_THIV6|nr:tape measure protein [Thiocystis violascens]AFL76241.1 tape measure domain protein [Thiocystis violascens DSM 198]
MSENALTVSVLLTLSAEDFARAVAEAQGAFEGGMDGVRAATDAAAGDAGAQLDDLGAGLNETAAASEDAGTKIGGFVGSLLSLDVLARGFGWLMEQAGDLMELADAWANLQAKLELATDSGAAAAQALADVQGIAQSTSSDIGATADLYATLSRALNSLGDETTSVAGLTRTITQAFAISGASAAESAGTITQLAQALASGQLRGDEFNSVMEQAPRLAQALADELGVTTGALRQMAEDGELTAEAVIGALSGQADAIAAEAASLPDTFERATTRLKNSLTGVVGGLNDALHGAELFATGTNLLAGVIGALASGIEALGGFLIAIASAFAAIPAPIYAAVAAMTATGVALALLSVNFAAVTGALATLALGLASVALAGWAAFSAQVAAAGTALRALWVLMLANPLTALAAVLGIVAAGFLAFNAASKESAASLAAAHDELTKQTTELEALRRTLATATPGTAAYTDAERQLATLVPGLTLSLNEQGLVVAKIGQGYEDNARALDAYIAAQKQASADNLLQQLVLASNELDTNRQALDTNTQSLRENYGIGVENRNGWQSFNLAVEQSTGGIDRLNRKQTDLANAANASEAKVRALALGLYEAGIDSGQAAEQLRALGRTDAEIARVVGQIDRLAEAALAAQGQLTATQQAIGAAGLAAAQSVGQAIQAVSTEIERLDGEIEQHRQTLDTALKAEGQGWRTLGEEAKSAYQGRLADIDALTQAQLAAVNQQTGNERTAAAQRAAIYRLDAQERLAALKTYENEAVFLVEQEYASRQDAARAAGADERALNVEMLTAKRATLQEIASAYKAHIDQLNADAQRHLSEVTRIEDQIRALKMSTEDRIREIQRGAMTDQAAYADRQRQVEETSAQAKRALVEGNFTLAKELAQKEMELASQLAREVKDGETVYVSKQRAADNASKTFLTGSQHLVEALEQEEQSHRDVAKEAQAAATAQETALTGVTARIDELSTKLDKELNLKLVVDSQAVQAEIDALAPLIQDKEYLLQTKLDLDSLKTSLDNAGALARDNPLRLQVALDGAQDELARLAAYAKDHPLAADLTVTTDKAETAIGAVQQSLSELDGLTTESAHVVQSNAGEVKQSLADLAGLTTDSTHRVMDNVDEVLRGIAELERDTSSTHTVYVREVKRNALGGLIHPFALSGVEGFANGGAVPGFPVPRWSTVPGSGNTDSVPASLAAGSFVLRKAASRYYGSSLLDLIQRFAGGGRVASLLMPGERLFNPGTVNRLGAGFFDALNQMRLPREALTAHLANLTAPVARFAAGGAVGPVATASAAARDSVDINLQIGRQAVRVQGARDQAQALASALKELQRGL